MSFVNPQPFGSNVDNNIIDPTEFETIAFDTDTNAEEIVGYDPKGAHGVERVRGSNRWKRQCCKCILYLLLIVVITVVVTYATLITKKKRAKVDYFSEAYTIRINAGATEPYYDSQNRYWLPDQALGNNDDFVVTVEDNHNTTVDEALLTQINDQCPLPNIKLNLLDTKDETDESIYCTDRTFSTTGRYEIAVPENNAPYQIDLYFCEVIYNRVGLRQFDISIENNVVVDNFDIFQDAKKAMNHAVKVTYIINVDDGYVSIVLKSKHKAAKINGIVVQRSDTLGDRR
jgi:Malectin domain